MGSVAECAGAVVTVMPTSAVGSDGAAASFTAGVAPRVLSAGLVLVLGAIVAMLVIAPLLNVFNIAFHQETDLGISELLSIAPMADVYTTAEYLQPLLDTLILALLVTTLSLVVGVGMAVIVARTDIRGRSIWDILIIIPLFMSPFTLLISWVALAGPNTGFLNGIGNVLLQTARGHDIVNINSYGGIVWVLFLVSCPLAYLFTVGTLRGMDASLEEASRSAGAGPLRTIAKITLPVCLPSILSAGLLIFVLTMETYTIPGIIGSAIGFTTLPWRLFEDAVSVPPRLAHAAAAGTLLLFITGAGVWAQRRITRFSGRYVTITGKGMRTKPFALGRFQWLLFSILALYVLCADVLPLIALVLSSFLRFSAAVPTLDALTVAHYTAFFTERATRAALPNTIVLAIGSGLLCVAIGLAISAMDLRKRRIWSTSLSAIGILPVAVPGLIFGFGLLWAYISTPMYGTIWILLLAYVARFLPYGIIVSRSAIQQVHPSLEECARMSGAGPSRALATITFPLIKPTLVSIMFLVMVQSVKELSASILLFTPKSQVLSTLAWQYVESGDFQFAATVGVIQTLMLIALIVATRYVFGLKLERMIGKDMA
jgi:iron(III) transport system permease protein